MSIMAYCVDRQAWQNPGSGCDTVLILTSDGVVQTEARHPSEHWPYTERFKSAKCMPRIEFRRTYNALMAGML